MLDLRNLYQAYCEGECFINEEILLGEKHFKEMSNMLYASGLAFAIPAKEANRVYLGFRECREARGLEELK